MKFGKKLITAILSLFGAGGCVSTSAIDYSPNFARNFNSNKVYLEAEASGKDQGVEALVRQTVDLGEVIGAKVEAKYANEARNIDNKNTRYGRETLDAEGALYFIFENGDVLTALGPSFKFSNKKYDGHNLLAEKQRASAGAEICINGGKKLDYQFLASVRGLLSNGGSIDYKDGREGQEKGVIAEIAAMKKLGYGFQLNVQGSLEHSIRSLPGSRDKHYNDLWLNARMFYAVDKHFSLGPGLDLQMDWSNFKKDPNYLLTGSFLANWKPDPDFIFGLEPSLQYNPAWERNYGLVGGIEGSLTIRSPLQQLAELVGLRKKDKK